MGKNASISFGIVIAHHSVPLAIALENLWDAEKKGAKEHQSPNGHKKDAVQMRVLYGNGNSLKATSKFDVFDQWRSLLNFKQTHSQVDFDPALFEQAAEVWQQHPAPVLENSPDCFAAIVPWTMAFCDRRELFKGEDKQTAKQDFQTALAKYLKAICQTTQPKERDREIQSWLKLAAFVLRKRDIKIGGIES
jgi:CRISPR-associated protein Cmr2